MIGVSRRPTGGGSVRSGGGHFAHVAGRPYRWNHDLLRADVETILGDLFQEPAEPVGVGPIPLTGRARLLPPAPNPFNPRVELRFVLSRTGRARLEVHDLRGRRVRTILDEELPAGEFSRTWDGRDDQGGPVASGVYTVRLRVGGTHDLRKVTLVR